MKNGKEYFHNMLEPLSKLATKSNSEVQFELMTASRIPCQCFGILTWLEGFIN